MIRVINIAKIAIGPPLLSDEHLNYQWLTRQEALRQGADESLRKLLSDERMFAFERLVAPTGLNPSEIARLMHSREHRKAA